MKIATTTGDFAQFCQTDEERIRELHKAGFRYIDFSMYSFTEDSPLMGENWKAEAEKLRKEIENLEAQIQALDLELDVYRSINLIGVQVTEKRYGTGTIVAQNANTIKVAFADGERSYIINKKYSMRPTFEDDVQIVEAMTEYEIRLATKKNFENQLRKLLHN